MARISLRAYHREIEELIETRQYEQAIAHCRHILKFYPKDVNSYRLLGKAYLESQRYGDASDIFLRVLSTVPDDFVSHVGMSIIREDEGNLDEAIWHMERAFETQPANNAIQAEMRRLHGRREGVEPPKIRLTRGALARMYLKGELYQQAIGELRAGLHEQPQRKDLQVVLAQAYYKSGQRIDAAEISSNLIKNLPYCLEANRILADILKQSERGDESQVYAKRVYSLDPYSAHTTPVSPSPEKVPDNAVLLERLEWRPGMPITQAPAQPEWASSLGVDLGTLTSEKDTQPDWLYIPPGEETSPPLEEAQPVVQESLEEITADIPAKDEAIPEWMQEAGWGPATGSIEESSALILDENGVSEGDLTPAEIPDWLKPMAPIEPTGAIPPSPEIAEVTPSAGEAEPVAVHPWLEETPPQPTDSIITWLGSKPPEVVEDASIDMGPSEEITIPDWLSELEQAPEGQPDSGLSDLAQQPIETELEEEPVLPDWSKAVTAPLSGAMVFDEAFPQESEDKDLLTGLVSDTHIVETPIGDISEWLSSLEPVGGDQTSPQIETPEVEWGDQIAASAEKPTHVEIPAWLAGLEAAAEYRESLTPEVENVALEPQTEYLELVGDQDEEATVYDTGQLPDWLTSVEPTGTLEEMPLADVEESLDVASPDALEVSSLPSEAGKLDDEEAFAWLENLAAQQGAEDALLLAPEERRETPPDWVQEATYESDLELSDAALPEEIIGAQIISEAAAEADEEFELPEQPVSEQLAVEELPVFEVETPVMEVASIALAGMLIEEAYEDRPTEPEEEMLFYPQEPPQPAETKTEPSESITIEEIPVLEEDTHPTSIRSPEVDLQAASMVTAPLVAGLMIQGESESKEPLEISESTEEITEPTFAETPDWVIEESFESVPEPVASSDEPSFPVTDEVIPLGDEDAFAWLEGLAAKQGSDEAMLHEAEERLETPPDWVIQSLAAKGEAESEPEIVSLPEWLQQAAPTEATPGAEQEAEIPEWLIAPAPLDQTDVEEAAEPEAVVPVLPTWLVGVDETENISQGWTPPEQELEAVLPVVLSSEPGNIEKQPEEMHVFEKIDLNEAGLNELERLPGIGFVKAQAIIDYRTSHGPFASVDDLIEVPGISNNTLDEFKDLVSVGIEELPVMIEQPVNENQVVLLQARNALVLGDIHLAVEKYRVLINQQMVLPEVISDLNEALYRFPVDVTIWETLGDAHVRNGHLQDALDAYTKAEEYIH